MPFVNWRFGLLAIGAVCMHALILCAFRKYAGGVSRTTHKRQVFLYIPFQTADNHMIPLLESKQPEALGEWVRYWIQGQIANNTGLVIKQKDLRDIWDCDVTVVADHFFASAALRVQCTGQPFSEPKEFLGFAAEALQQISNLSQDRHSIVAKARLVDWRVTLYDGNFAQIDDVKHSVHPSDWVIFVSMFFTWFLMLLGFWMVSKPSDDSPDDIRIELAVDTVFTIAKELKLIGPIFTGYLVRKYFANGGIFPESHLDVVKNVGQVTRFFIMFDLIFANLFPSSSWTYWALGYNFDVYQRPWLSELAWMAPTTVSTCLVMLIVTSWRIRHSMDHRAGPIPNSHTAPDAKLFVELTTRFEASFVQNDIGDEPLDLVKGVACFCSGIHVAVVGIILKASFALFFILPDNVALAFGLIKADRIAPQNLFPISVTDVAMSMLASLVLAVSTSRFFRFYSKVVLRAERTVEQLLDLKSIVKVSDVKLDRSFKARLQLRGLPPREQHDPALLQLLPQGAASSTLEKLDLSQNEDLLAWYSVRELMKLNFRVTMWLVDAVCSISIVHAVANAASALIIWVGLWRYQMMALFVMNVLNIAIFVAFLTKPLLVCVALNELLDQDMHILAEVRNSLVLFRAEQSLSKLGKPLALNRLSNDDLSLNIETKETLERHLELLSVIESKIKDPDSQLEVFGIKVTKAFANGLLFSIVGPLASLAIGQMLALAEQNQLD